MDPLIEFMYTVLDQYRRVAADAGAETRESADDIDGTRIAATTDDGTRDIAILHALEWDEGQHIALHDPQALLTWVRAHRQLVQHLEALITTADLVVDDPIATTLLTGAAIRALRIMPSPTATPPDSTPHGQSTDTRASIPLYQHDHRAEPDSRGSPFIKFVPGIRTPVTWPFGAIRDRPRMHVWGTGRARMSGRRRQLGRLASRVSESSRRPLHPELVVVSR